MTHDIGHFWLGCVAVIVVACPVYRQYPHGPGHGMTQSNVGRRGTRGLPRTGERSEPTYVPNRLGFPPNPTAICSALTWRVRRGLCQWAKPHRALLLYLCPPEGTGLRSEKKDRASTTVPGANQENGRHVLRTSFPHFQCCCDGYSSQVQGDSFVLLGATTSGELHGLSTSPGPRRDWQSDKLNALYPTAFRQCTYHDIRRSVFVHHVALMRAGQWFTPHFLPHSLGLADSRERPAK